MSTINPPEPLGRRQSRRQPRARPPGDAAGRGPPKDWSRSRVPWSAPRASNRRGELALSPARSVVPSAARADRRTTPAGPRRSTSLARGVFVSTARLPIRFLNLRRAGDIRVSYGYSVWNRDFSGGPSAVTGGKNARWARWGGPIVAGADAQPRRNDAYAAVRPLCAERPSAVDARGTFARRGTVKRAATSDARRQIEPKGKVKQRLLPRSAHPSRTRGAPRGDGRAERTGARPGS